MSKRSKVECGLPAYCEVLILSVPPNEVSLNLTVQGL